MALALAFGMTALSANESTGASQLRYSLISDYEMEYGNPKSVIWLGGYGQPENDSGYSEVELNGGLLPGDQPVSELGVGAGVAPLFSEYGVLRANGNMPGSTYLALGVVVDEATMDETELPNSWDVIDLSYGIGVSKSSYDVEYMLSMDEEGDGVSAVGLGINSRF